MNIVILSRNAKLYSTRRLIEACEGRGHNVRVIDILKCYIDIASDNAAIWYEGEKLENVDAVIPRIGASVTHYGLAVIRQFEMMGVYCLTESIALARSRDKLRALQLLSKKGLGLPKTSVAHNVDDANELIKLVGGTPLVVKLSEGTQGRGIVLAETPKAAESVIEAFKELKAEFLVQEFITEANGCDLRCFVIGNKVVAAMERKAQAGEFRSNLHRGGSATAAKITALERKTAVKAAQVMGLKIAGVDLLRSHRGPLVMEVNSSPGLEGIEKSSGKNIADLMVAFLEKNSNPDKKVHS